MDRQSISLVVTLLIVAGYVVVFWPIGAAFC